MSRFTRSQIEEIYRTHPQRGDAILRRIRTRRGSMAAVTVLDLEREALALAVRDLCELLEIPDDAPVRWKRTLKSRGHHTLWGDPSYLLGRVVSIVAV